MGITPIIRMLRFILINSVLLNLLCVWIYRSGEINYGYRYMYKCMFVFATVFLFFIFFNLLTYCYLNNSKIGLILL